MPHKRIHSLNKHAQLSRGTRSLSIFNLCILREYLYSKFSFGELYRRIYGRIFSFTVTCQRSRKTNFPNISDDYIPK